MQFASDRRTEASRKTGKAALGRNSQWRGKTSKKREALGRQRPIAKGNKTLTQLDVDNGLKLKRHLAGSWGENRLV